jgi:hypothetical protein
MGIQIIKNTNNKFMRGIHRQPFVFGILVLITSILMIPGLSAASQSVNTRNVETVSKLALIQSEDLPAKPNTPSSLKEKYDPKKEILENKFVLYKTVRIQNTTGNVYDLIVELTKLVGELNKIRLSSPTSTNAIDIAKINTEIKNINAIIKKSNLSYELPKLKTELEKEQNKRVADFKKELKKKNISYEKYIADQTRIAETKARDANRMSDMKQVQTALELYYTDINSYPAGTNAVLGSGNYACLNASGFQAAGCTNPYMGRIPMDRTTSSKYVYTKISDNSYSVRFTVEGEINGLKGNLVLNQSGISSAK